MDNITEIKSRLSIEDLVAQYVPLKKAGRSFKALCPFHKEKTPSFIVSPEKQIAYCFGCNRGGDIFKFVQEMEGVDFGGAIKLLAEKTGVKLTYDTKFASQKKEEKQVLYDVNKKTADFFIKRLWETKEGKKVLNYTKKRGLKEKTIKDFKLGLSPDSFEETYKYLLKEGFTKQEIVNAGLGVAKDTECNDIYDRFRLRLIFPISDSQGRIVGFGGRVLRKGDEPKYLNSPESLIYHKSSILYGFDLAKTFIKKEDQVVIVEGYMDVISSFQAGIKNVIASSGTAVAQSGLQFLKRYTKNFVFAFDSDEAGMEAMKRAVELAQPLDINIKIIKNEKYKDPDECIKENPKLWAKLISQASNYMDFYFDLAFSSGSNSKEVAATLLPVIKRVSNLVEKDQYVKKLALKLEVSPEVIYGELDKQKIFSHSMQQFREEKKDIESYSLDEYLAGLVFQFPDYAKEVESDIKKSNLSKKFKGIVSKFLKSDSVAIDNLLGGLDPDVQNRLKILMLRLETYYREWNKSNFISEVNKVIDRMKAARYDRRRKKLLVRMWQAREKGETEEEQALFEKYCKI